MTRPEKAWQHTHSIDHNRKNGNMKKYLPPKEAAEYVGYKTSTLAKKRCSGTGPRYYKIEGNIRYTTDDLDRWMGTDPQQSTSEDAEKEAA